MSVHAAEHFFKSAATEKIPSLALVRGDDPYLCREFFDLVREKDIELHRFEVKASGPDANVESAALGMGLFAQKTLIWLKAKESPSKWTKDSLHRWQSLHSNADGQTLFVVVQAPEDRRLKWDSLEIEYQVNWASGELNQIPWIQRMIKKREWDAGKERLDFLARLGLDLIEIDTAVELWSLGGDLWASKSLGWGSPSAGVNVPAGHNAAFDWVDAVVEGRRKDAVALSRHLVDEEGAEPIQLLALLSKSLRLVATLSRGWNTKDYPEFLIRKWRSRPLDAKRIDALLGALQQIDLRLKSSASDSLANLQHLSAI
ncbi:MAG TPA: hypothetical protein VM901_04600 [Bdellovibrionota bacterium]|jgi:DNA polymerase III delta subunit|nr:hypothetical protein [Bdellovibrionota bacterium]